MKRVLRALSGQQKGLSLLELTVVAAIISILAALTAVAVTGTTSSTKASTRTADVAEVQKAVDNFFAGNDEWPTTDGDLLSPTDVDEAAVGVDLDGDGFTTGTDIAVKAILWTASGANGEFYPAYIGKKPNHAGTSVTDISDAVGNQGFAEAWVIITEGALANKVTVLVSGSNY